MAKTDNRNGGYDVLELDDRFMDWLWANSFCYLLGGARRLELLAQFTSSNARWIDEKLFSHPPPQGTCYL